MKYKINNRLQFYQNAVRNFVNKATNSNKYNESFVDRSRPMFTSSPLLTLFQLPEKHHQA